MSTTIPVDWLIAAALPIVQLSVDEANSYVMHRWPLSLGATVAAQFRAAVRFSEQR